MDVYVVSISWRGSGASIMGVATDRPGAEQIADRSERSWGKWIGIAAGERWTRDVPGLPAGGCPGGVWQEIVKVPLAGMPAALPVRGTTPVNYVGPTVPSDAVAVDPLSQVYAEHVRVADRLNGFWRQRINDSLAEIEEIGRQYGAP